jgi:YD repeat-containing protein
MAATIYRDFDARLQVPRQVISLRKELDGETPREILYQYYDGQGRLLQSAAAAGEGKFTLTSIIYNDKGQKTAVWGPYGSNSPSYVGNPETGGLCTSVICRHEGFTYDQGRIKTHSVAIVDNEDSGKVATTYYSYNLFARTVTDPDGRIKVEQYDDLGRLIKITDAKDSTTKYKYNGAGDLLEITGPSGKTIKFNYDLRGKKKSYFDPNTMAAKNKWSYEYDGNGNLMKATGPDGQIVTYDPYDELNRPTKITATKGKDMRETTFTYDLGEVTNGRDRLSTATRDGVTKRITHYDEMGRIKGEEKSFILPASQKTKKGRAANLPTYVTSYTYDKAGRLATLGYPGNSYQVTYNYFPGTNQISQSWGRKTIFWRSFPNMTVPRGR